MSERRRMGRGIPAAALLMGLATALVASPGVAQSTAALAASCARQAAGALPGPEERCADAALAAHAVQGGIGLLAGAGGPVPASPSTAGWRVHRSPRWVMDVGMAWGSFPHPDLSDARLPERRSLGFAPRFTVAAGLFEGFSPAATVGGVAAVDLVGEFRLLPVFAHESFQGAVSAWGVGVRVGVVRESFTLPGVTISAVHRRAGRLTMGDRDDDVAGVEVTPRVTSLRAVVGKDLLEIGLSGGVQVDRIRGRARVAAPWSSGVSGEILMLESERLPLPLDRTVWFLGANRTWVVAQLAASVEWSPPASPRPGIQGTGPYDGSKGALTGSLSVRITY